MQRAPPGFNPELAENLGKERLSSLLVTSGPIPRPGDQQPAGGLWTKYMEKLTRHSETLGVAVPNIGELKDYRIATKFLASNQIKGNFDP